MKSTKFIITVVTIGSAIEWFGFTLFGLMTPLLISYFLPKNFWGAAWFYPTLMLLSTLVRPAGGLVFGKMGDRQGRTFILVRTIGFMMIPLVLTSLLPSYETLGIATVFILGFIFLLQGFSLGGEFPGSAVFIIESARKHQKGYMGSWVYCSAFLGMFLATAEALLLSDFLSPHDSRQWGWRVSFLLTALIACIALFFRRRLHETHSFHNTKEFGHLDKAPLLDTFHKHTHALLYGIGLFVLETAIFDSILVFAPFYLHKVLHLTLFQAAFVALTTMAVFTLMTPIAGYASIRVGVKRLTRWALYAVILTTFPLYYIISSQIFWAILLSHAILAAILSCYLSNLPALICSLFPVAVRCSGVSASMNISVAVFASLGNLLMNFLINQQAEPFWLGLYLGSTALVSLWSLSKIKDYH